nr:GNAT family N-acetyltransferase [Streptomyces abikoensis]
MEIRTASDEDWPGIYRFYSVSRGPDPRRGAAVVDPAHQGKGIGRALGEHVIDWSRAEGFRGIQFNAVVEANRPASSSGCT